MLVVGADTTFQPALKAALARHRVFVETAEIDAVVDAVVAAAPDVILLMGAAARDCGSEVLDRLVSLPQSSVVPIVILSDDTELDAKLRAFRHGAAAVIPRSASVDAIAERIASLAREIPERGGEALGVIGEATLEDFVGALSKQLRSGILTVRAGEGRDADPVRLVLGRGRPLADFVDEFVRRVRRHVVLAEPLEYEFDERAGGTIELLDGDTEARSSSASVSGLRIVLADDDTGRADGVAQELRSRGAVVVVTDLQPAELRFQKLRQVDPTILMIGDGHVQGEGYGLLKRMREDTRLRWASLLVVRWNEVWSEQTGVPAIERFESTLAGLAEPERSLRERCDAGVAFDTRLEVTGPARLLRVLADSHRPLRVSVHNPRIKVEVDFWDGLIVGASARTQERPPQDVAGAAALAGMLVLGSGRVRVAPVEQPAAANLMATVDVALNMAEAEAPPILPSLPAPESVSIRPPLQTSPPPGPRLPPPPKPVSPPSSAAVAPSPIIPLRGAEVAFVEPEEEGRVAEVPRPPRRAPPALAAARTTLPGVDDSEFGGTDVADPAGLPAIENIAQPLPQPPALPAGVPVAASPASPASPASLFGRAWKKARDSFTELERTVHRPPPYNRIPVRTALVLVGIAAVQGLVIALGIYAVRKAGSWWSGDEGAASASFEPAASAAAMTQPVLAPPRAEKAAREPPPAPAPSSAESKSSAAFADGSDRSVSGCDALLAADPPQEGYYPGAAYQEARTGRQHIVRGNLEAAQAAFCRAERWDRENPSMATQLSHVFLLRRDGEQTKKWARRALELGPASSKAKELLGDGLARTGAAAEARTSWFEAAGLNPMIPEEARGLLVRELRQAEQARRRKDYLSAERFYRRAAFLAPGNVEALTGLTVALTRLGDGAAAVSWGRRAVEAAPRDAEARVALGDALAKVGDAKQAEAEWREAGLLDPTHRGAKRRLSTLE
ncbi:MAG TPA: tetratricopeptide repeat protein [Polyangiaceae bacterium]